MSTPTVAAHNAAAREGVRLVVIDLDALKIALREVLAEMQPRGPAPDFYTQTSLPPGMSRKAFLEAIRRGDLPARAAGKIRFVARADFEAFITKAPPVRVRTPRQPSPANDVRAIVRASQGK